MGASTRPLVQKFGLKPAHKAVILHAPEHFTLGKVPAGVALQKKLGSDFDFIVAFFEKAADFKAELPKIKSAMKKSGMAWICWMKGNKTDLSRDEIWRISETKGLETVSSISIDQDWSALKLMYPKAMRKD